MRPDYYAVTRKRYDSIIRELETFINKHDIDYFDFQYLSETGTVEFYDAIHMEDKSSRIFSKELGDRMKLF